MSASKEVMHETTPWQVIGLRLTAFLSQPPTQDNEALWRRVVEHQADHVTAPPAAGTKKNDGSFKQGRLTMQTHPGRADILLMAPAMNPLQAVLQPEGSTVLGPLAQSLEDFVPMALGWLVDLGASVNRVALGATLDDPTSKDRPDAYRALGKYLHSLKLDAENSSDFAYQINRPRASNTLPGERVNRYVRWSAFARYQAQFTLSPMVSASFMPSHPRLITIGPHAEIDVNTVSSSSGTDLPPEHLAAVVRELRALVVEIAEKGDVP